MLQYTELPPDFALKSVKWPVLEKFSSKHPQLVKEVELAVKGVETAIEKVNIAVKVKGFNVPSSSNLNENPDSELQLLDIQLQELLQIKMFLEAVTNLINDVNFLVNYKSALLANEGVSNYEGMLLEVFEKIVLNSNFCNEMFTYFEENQLYQSQFEIQSIPKYWKTLIFQIHADFTKYNYFTKEIFRYFNYERADRKINRLNISNRIQIGFFKGKTENYQAERLPIEERQALYEN